MMFDQALYPKDSDAKAAFTTAFTLSSLNERSRSYTNNGMIQVVQYVPFILSYMALLLALVALVFLSSLVCWLYE